MYHKMKKSLRVLLVFILLFSLGIPTNNVSANIDAQFDTIITGGTILDGSGLERYDADIAIKDGHIAKIGDLSEYTAKEEVNADGQFVAPGFVDIHSHASLSALKRAQSSLTQGVTTEILSPDGGGPTDVTSRFNLEEDGLGINVGTYIGFNSVWKEVVGHDDRRATAEEIEEMQGLIRTAMQEGAAGVSAGLFYRPAYFADKDEVIDVVSAARDWRTNFPNHQRNENNDVLEATAETIEIGEKSGLVPVVTHIKTMGPNNWGKSEQMIQMIDDANERGVYTAADIYPYLRSQTGLTAIVPPWVEEGGRSEMLKRFADSDLRDAIAEEIEEIMYSRVEGPEGVYFPTKRKTLADYMETGVGNPRSRTLLAFLNLNYENEFDVDIQTLQVKDGSEKVVYDYNFNGNDEDGWDETKFDLLHTYPSDAVNYSIKDNLGKVNVAKRIDGNGSAYGKVTPTMPDVKNSETTMRFRVGDTLGDNQIIRLWVNSDDFGSGSSFPINGYGIALRLDRNELVLRGRENGSSEVFQSMDANLVPDDWFDLKVRVKDDELAAKIWPASEEEPTDWGMVQDVSKEEVIEDQKAMVSLSNLDANEGNTFYFDDFKVKSVTGDEEYFNDSFEGENGAAWNNEKFNELHAYPTDPAGARYTIQDNAGKVSLAKRNDELCCSSYGKIAPKMGDVKNSDVVLRFRMGQVGGNQQLRVFTKADKFLSGMAMPVNGFGIEFDAKSDQLSLIRRNDGTTEELDRIDANMNTEWHTLRLRAVDNEVHARIWEDGEEEPEDWNLSYVKEERELTIGETTMQILETEGSLRTIYAFGHEDDFERFFKHPNIAVASDGGATTSDSTHARRYGSQPRALGKYVREEGLVSWEEGIRKLTSLPASIIGLSDRGYISEGMVADITIFDPEAIIDHATFEDPKQYADGVEHVIVNGQFALADGEVTGIQAGQGVRVQPNMPSRPFTEPQDIQTAENRMMVALDGAKSNETASIAFDLNQATNATRAEGTLQIVDESKGIDFVAEDFGKIQLFDGWQSFTGSGILNGEELTTFRVTIDENDPMINDERPVVTIDIVGEPQIKAFLGEQLSDEVNKEALQAKIVEIKEENLQEDVYTEDSWQLFMETLQVAEDVLADKEATQLEVDQALENLRTAYTALEEKAGDVNKDALEEKVTEMEEAALDEMLYTEASWSTFVEALDEAKAVLEDEQVTQAEVDEALANVEEAYAGLEYKLAFDKEALENKINEVEEANLEQSTYKEVSWAMLDEALTTAKEVFTNEEATQWEVNEALAYLQLAYDNLEEKGTQVDRQALQDQVDEIKGANLEESSYTKESWTAFTVALEAAADILEKDNEAITQLIVDQTLAELEAAYTSLEETAPEVDKTDLVDKVKEIKDANLDASAYTEASWSAFQSALEEAEAAIATDDVTQAEVDATLSALETAYKALEKKAPDVDKSGLERTIKEMEEAKLDVSTYTKASWSAFQSALETAEKVVADEEATQDEVDHARENVEKAFQALEKKQPGNEVDKEALQHAVKEVNDKNLDEQAYTEASWKAFAEALSTAEQVLADQNTSQFTVDQALSSLEQAYEALKERQTDTGINKEALETFIATIKGENLDEQTYTEATWEAFAEALAAGEQVLADADATQAAVDTALSNLKEAFEGLENRGKGNDEEQKEEETEKAGEGDTLPRTSTSLFNIMLVGFALLSLGFVIYKVRQYRMKNE